MSCVHDVFHGQFHGQFSEPYHDKPPDISSEILKHVLSTATSPALEVVVVYQDYAFHGVRPPGYPALPPVRSVSRAERTKEALQHHLQLEVFREIHELRDFRLVLREGVWHRVGEHSVRVLEEAVEAEKARGGFDVGFPEPLVMYRPRESQTTIWQDYFVVGSPMPRHLPDEIGHSCC